MRLETIDCKNFAPYGTVLELTESSENPVFQIPVEVPDSPWRIAILKILPRELEQIECHPDSRESFEPVNGWTVLFAGSARMYQHCTLSYLTARFACIPGSGMAL